MHVTACPKGYQTYRESAHATRGRWKHSIVPLYSATRGRGVSLTVCRPDVAAGLETRAGYGVVASGRLAAVEIQARRFRGIVGKCELRRRHDLPDRDHEQWWGRGHDHRLG